MYCSQTFLFYIHKFQNSFLEITCPPLPTLKHGTLSGDCPTTNKGKYGDTCSFVCPQDGYELVVAPTVTCEEDGHWFPTIDKENVNICNGTINLSQIVF